ncbi:MAG TPA: hypothetical protein VFT00_08225 [Nocardioides sp.]|nr:hypothetical protein [Nocardioides sp.]
MGEDELERSEIEAVLETRRELGPSYDAALVDSFAERIERAVEKRTAEVVSSRDLGRIHTDGAGKRQLALGIVSTVAAVPISITLGVSDQPLALIVSWAGIVGVNVAHALQGRSPR